MMAKPRDHHVGTGDNHLMRRSICSNKPRVIATSAICSPASPPSGVVGGWCRKCAADRPDWGGPRSQVAMPTQVPAHQLAFNSTSFR